MTSYYNLSQAKITPRPFLFVYLFVSLDAILVYSNVWIKECKVYDLKRSRFTIHYVGLKIGGCGRNYYHYHYYCFYFQCSSWWESFMLWDRLKCVCLEYRRVGVPLWPVLWLTWRRHSHQRQWLRSALSLKEAELLNREAQSVKCFCKPLCGFLELTHLALLCSSPAPRGLKRHVQPYYFGLWLDFPWRFSVWTASKNKFRWCPSE